MIAKELYLIHCYQDIATENPSYYKEFDEETEDQPINLENIDVSDEQKKYIDFNNKRIKELETHFTHLKIEMNENELSEEKMNAQDKRNAGE